MDITELKSGFCGYKKSYVCEYVAEMNEKFFQKLMTTIKEYDQQIEELNEKINRLDAENSVLQKKCINVTQVIVDANKFSDELRVKAKDNEFGDRNMDDNYEQMQRIHTLCMGIDKICDSMRPASIDKDLESNKRNCQPLTTSLKRMLNQRKAQ